MYLHGGGFINGGSCCFGNVKVFDAELGGDYAEDFLDVESGKSGLDSLCVVMWGEDSGQDVGDEEGEEAVNEAHCVVCGFYN